MKILFALSFVLVGIVAGVTSCSKHDAPKPAIDSASLKLAGHWRLNNSGVTVAFDIFFDQTKNVAYATNDSVTYNGITSIPATSPILDIQKSNGLFTIDVYSRIGTGSSGGENLTHFQSCSVNKDYSQLTAVSGISGSYVSLGYYTSNDNLVLRFSDPIIIARIK